MDGTDRTKMRILHTHIRIPVRLVLCVKQPTRMDLQPEKGRAALCIILDTGNDTDRNSLMLRMEAFSRANAARIYPYPGRACHEILLVCSLLRPVYGHPCPVRTMQQTEKQASHPGRSGSHPGNQHRSHILGKQTRLAFRALLPSSCHTVPRILPRSKQHHSYRHTSNSAQGTRMPGYHRDWNYCTRNCRQHRINQTRRINRHFHIQLCRLRHTPYSWPNALFTSCRTLQGMHLGRHDRASIHESMVSALHIHGSAHCTNLSATHHLHRHPRGCSSKLIGNIVPHSPYAHPRANQTN